MRPTLHTLMLASASLIAAVSRPADVADYDVVIRNGTLYDGSGAEPARVDVAIRGDSIAAIGDLGRATAELEIDASGLAVSPGFINMLSWANESLLHDGRSLSDLRQGVTLEVLGEGRSMGPLNELMKQELIERQGDIRYDVVWNTLGEYLRHLEERGIATNVASYVGATTVRLHELGYQSRAATPEEIARMQRLVEAAMAEGALGVSSSLPYVPAPFASTDELISLSRTAAAFGGMYISHLRSEGDAILEALEEFLTIVREAGIRGEIYHLKVSRQRNWHKLSEVIRRIEQARAEGLAVTANMYTYRASSTGLDYDLPAWVKEGGHEAFMRRLRDPALRTRLATEMELIPPHDILLVDFRHESLRHLTGRTLAEVAAMRSVSPPVAAMDLMLEDDSRIGTVRFTMSEENVRTKIALPWVSFCSDSASIAPEKPFTNSQPHPRAYGSFARLLGRYVRIEGIIPLQDAIHRLTGLPARNLKLDRRGRLATGFFADVVVFDPRTIIDHATFEQPHQLATGVVHVFVNGQQVLRHGEPTGLMPGRFVKGPGWRPGQ